MKRLSKLHKKPVSTSKELKEKEAFKGLLRSLQQANERSTIPLDNTWDEL